MELCVHDKTTANPSTADIVAAIDARPHPADWYLVLESDESFIDAGELADGTYEVTASDRGRNLQADASFEADRLKELLAKFLAGDGTWRDMGFSQIANAGAKAGSGTVGPAGSKPPAWALGIVIGTIAIVVIAFMFDVRSFLGFGDSDLFYVGLIGAPLVALLVVAVLVKMLEVRRASAWTTAAGRVVKSSTQARRHGFAGEATTVTTVPLVEYEFSVGGSTFRGNRISIGEDSGGANTEATLRRYPVGTVVSVYYDPDNPGNCVLEREIPKGVGKGLFFLLAFVAAVIAGIYYLATNGSRLLSQLPDSIDNKPFVIIAACFGLVVLLFFIASYRRSRRAADWPLVRGKVLQSGSEQVRSNDSDGRTRTTYAPVVEYRYSVNGVDYVSRQIKLGIVMSSSQSYATKVAARYPKGSDVDVHYDPANPSSAALENPSGFYWLLLAVALGCFALAARAGGFI
jgi:hypothetical protein